MLSGKDYKLADAFWTTSKTDVRTPLDIAIDPEVQALLMLIAAGGKTGDEAQ